MVQEASIAFFSSCFAWCLLNPLRRCLEFRAHGDHDDAHDGIPSNITLGACSCSPSRSLGSIKGMKNEPRSIKKHQDPNIFQGALTLIWHVLTTFFITFCLVGFQSDIWRLGFSNQWDWSLTSQRPRISQHHLPFSGPQHLHLLKFPFHIGTEASWPHSHPSNLLKKYDQALAKKIHHFFRFTAIPIFSLGSLAELLLLLDSFGTCESNNTNPALNSKTTSKGCLFHLFQPKVWTNQFWSLITLPISMAVAGPRKRKQPIKNSSTSTWNHGEKKTRHKRL